MNDLNTIREARLAKFDNNNGQPESSRAPEKRLVNFTDNNNGSSSNIKGTALNHVNNLVSNEFNSNNNTHQITDEFLLDELIPQYNEILTNPHSSPSDKFISTLKLAYLLPQEKTVLKDGQTFVKLDMLINGLNNLLETKVSKQIVAFHIKNLLQLYPEQKIFELNVGTEFKGLKFTDEQFKYLAGVQEFAPSLNYNIEQKQTEQQKEIFNTLKKDTQNVHDPKIIELGNKYYLHMQKFITHKLSVESCQKAANDLLTAFIANEIKEINASNLTDEQKTRESNNLTIKLNKVLPFLKQHIHNDEHITTLDKYKQWDEEEKTISNLLRIVFSYTCVREAGIQGMLLNALLDEMYKQSQGYCAVGFVERLAWLPEVTNEVNIDNLDRLHFASLKEDITSHIGKIVQRIEEEEITESDEKKLERILKGLTFAGQNFLGLDKKIILKLIKSQAEGLPPNYTELTKEQEKFT